MTDKYQVEPREPSVAPALVMTYIVGTDYSFVYTPSQYAGEGLLKLYTRT